MAARTGAGGMHGRRLFCTLLVVLFLVLLLVSPAVLAAPGPANTTITVVMDNNYPPFSFRDADGNLVGYSVDLWKLWEKQTGIPVVITGLEWDEAQQRMVGGEFDVIDTVFYSEERARIYDFTKPYMDIEVPIFFNTNISGISDIDSLNGFVVGMNKGDSTVEEIREHGITVREYPSYEEVVKAAKRGEISVFILDRPGGMYYLHREGIQDQFRTSPPTAISGALHRAVRKGNPDLVALIDNGFDRVPQGDRETLDRKWYGTPLIPAGFLQQGIAAGLVVLAILVVLLVMNRTLKNTVDRKTAELKMQLARSEKAEADLRHSEERNAAILTALPDLLFVLSRDGTFLDFQAPEQAPLLMKRDAIIGRNIRDTGFDPATTDEVLKTISRALDSGTLEHLQYSLTLPGGIQHFEARIIRLDAGRVLGIVRDVTDQKLAEEQLRESQRALATLMSNLPGMAYRCRNDPSWTMEFVSMGCYDLTGYHDSELLLNRRVSYADIIHPDDRAMVWDSVQEGVTRHQPFRMVYRINTATGEEKWVWEQGCGVFSASGTLEALEGFITNITERKLAEQESALKSEELHAAYEEMTATAEELKRNCEELGRSQAALAQARKKLNIINTITFQDIGNAIFSLAGYYELDKNLLPEEKAQNYRAKEIGSIHTIADSLKFAEYYQNLGLNPPRWQPVGQAFLFGISHMDLSRLTRHLDVDGLEIYADPLLETVFFTLADNVLRHGRTATEIRLFSEKTGSGIRIVFEDNGAGIAMEEKELIFARAPATKKGMSLFLAREILEITGITIKETGEPGKGARFEMLVPDGAWRIGPGKT
ncbi:MAG: transporter substrate-binding domain-containing protein [Methanomicrobiales archaeon]|nr:transporter substrate-binding domain-containing protein [Methanomicrobiales archaeon]